MAKEVKMIITDPVGLYATPVTELVDIIKLFNCHVHLIYDEKEINMKSMMGVLSLGVPSKAHIIIKADGQDEDTAIETIKNKIVSMNIGEIL